MLKLAKNTKLSCQGRCGISFQDNMSGRFPCSFFFPYLNCRFLLPLLLNLPKGNTAVDISTHILYYLWCPLSNGAQCCQLYLWTAHIPMIGTKIRHHAKNPQPHGLFNTVPQNLANCNITLVKLKG